MVEILKFTLMLILSAVYISTIVISGAAIVLDEVTVTKKGIAMLYLLTVILLQAYIWGR